jgi:hypothetical protein
MFQQKSDTRSIKVDLPVLYFMEDNLHYAYMPSLDLTGYGNTVEEANESLSIVMEEFLSYTMSKRACLLKCKS